LTGSSAAGREAAIPKSDAETRRKQRFIGTLYASTYTVLSTKY
jgi:hypothetical protein